MLKNLGQKIRALRKEKNLTLVEIAEKTGIAQATLSRIETGTMIGTIESHEKIAEVLGIGLSELYTGVDGRHEQIALLSQTSERKVTALTKKVQLELLTQESSRKKITPLLLTLQPEGETAVEQQERGVEKFFYVLDGEVVVWVDQKSFILTIGETIYFDASLPHQIKNTKNKTAKVLLTVSPSKI